MEIPPDVVSGSSRSTDRRLTATALPISTTSGLKFSPSIRKAPSRFSPSMPAPDVCSNWPWGPDASATGVDEVPPWFLGAIYATLAACAIAVGVAVP
jgi:hypothetical protein